MHNQVIADIEIDGDKITHYSTVIIRQQFNAHHEFAIRVKYDVLEKMGTFSLGNAQKLIGKTAIIKLLQANSLEAAYEFHGIICEIAMEQSDNFTSDFVLKGYSPTILMETGAHLASFYKKGLQQIVKQITESISGSGFGVKIAPQYKSPITYICQYRESGFHFMNRLSSEYGEWCYYDGQQLFFGRPSSSPDITITYGEDVHSMQLKLRILPLLFTNYAYVSKNDSLLTYNAPKNVDGLDEYASNALKESNKIFSQAVQSPIRQRVESSGELQDFAKKQKAAMAAELEVLTGSSDNPSLCIGAVADVKISVLQNTSMLKEDGGRFLITSIEHHITENGKYFNYFEGLPSNTEVVPVKNIILPIAEPQTATVTDNADPDNLGRVKVQMLWQQESGGTTDWVRVMTPDAGSSGQVSKNRGFVFIPEVGDQVLLCFRYNDPDRPFVLGSIFHGKTAAGGGSDNNSKTLSTKSGHTIELNDTKGSEKVTVITQGKHVIELNDTKGAESITVKDKNNNCISIDTPGNCITIQDKNGNNVMIDAKSNGINITAKGSITLAAMNINLVAGATVNVQATAAFNLNALNSLSNVSMNTMLRTKNLTHMVGNTLSSSATTINQTAKKDINHKATGKIIISAKEKLDQHAAEMDISTKEGKLRLKSSSDLEIKGSTVKTN